MVVAVLQTQPNSVAWYDLKRKKPFLQLKILRLIGKSGRLSKSMTEKILTKHNHHHREILESYTALEKKGLISEMKYENPGVGKTLPRGRKKRYYQITDLGFSVLIDEGIDAREFWMTMVNYCYYAKAVDSHTIDYYYRSFLNQHLKYKSVIDNGYFFSQLDVFDHMSKKWISDKILANGNEVSLSQKIIETLAMFPGLTFKDITHEINVPEHRLNMELREGGYEAFLIDRDEYYDRNTLCNQMSNILSHNLVKRTTHDQGKENTLSLSVFGVILSVKLMRLRNLNMIKRLYLFNDYSMQNAIDLIADNYRKSLPLIFAEWALLKRILKILSIYNFDIIIGLKQSVYNRDISILSSGNKEYYDDMAGITAYSRKQLADISNKGIDICREFERKGGSTKIEAVYNKLIEIQGLLGYGTSDAFLDRSKLEEAFANEISFHYFLNLNQDIFIPPLNAMEYYTEIETLLSEDRHDKFLSTEYDRYSLAPQLDHLIPISPRLRLLDILDNSRVIRNALMNLINDCIVFHKQTGTFMDKFYNEIRGRYMIRLLNFPEGRS